MEISKVASFIDAAIIASGKTHATLAKELGYSSVNIISMFRGGKTHLPIAKIQEAARAFGVDEMELTRLVLKERYPEVYEVLERHGSFLEPDELDVLNEYRRNKNRPKQI